MAELAAVVETVWVNTEEVGVGVVRSWISVWSCQLEVLASSSKRMSSMTCDIALKEAVVAEWSFVLSDVISAVRESVCSQ